MDKSGFPLLVGCSYSGVLRVFARAKLGYLAVFLEILTPLEHVRRLAVFMSTIAQGKYVFEEVCAVLTAVPQRHQM